jgi:hypothetical protein
MLVIGSTSAARMPPTSAAKRVARADGSPDGLAR